MDRKKLHKNERIGISLLLLLPALLVWWPLWFMLTSAFMPADELTATIGPALGLAGGDSVWHLFPSWPTLLPVLSLLLDTPQFFVVFWNTVGQTFAQMAGQLLVGIPAAWALSVLRFRGRGFLRLLYLALMLMPFTATMVPSYLILRAFGWIDTVWAIIVPGVFSTFPVFIMQKWFDNIPNAIIEAAKIDGASPEGILWRIGVPLGAPGILAAMTLSFFEAWNAVEQPMTFLRRPENWPLALYLGNFEGADIGAAMTASFFTLLPAVLIFRFGQKYLEQGIQMGAVKE